MKFSPVPRYVFRKITDITPVFLERLGVKFLMLDLDNTIVSYSKHIPPPGVLPWAENMRLSGIDLYIVSNSKRHGRVEKFAEAFHIGFIRHASKPSPKALFRAMKHSGYSAGESALAGDQVYTDVLAANRAGVVSIAVRPVSRFNPFLAIRYALEVPFRAACKNKMIRSIYG